MTYIQDSPPIDSILRRHTIYDNVDKYVNDRSDTQILRYSFVDSCFYSEGGFQFVESLTVTIIAVICLFSFFLRTGTISFDDTKRVIHIETWRPILFGLDCTLISIDYDDIDDFLFQGEILGKADHKYYHVYEPILVTKSGTSHVIPPPQLKMCTRGHMVGICEHIMAFHFLLFGRTDGADNVSPIIHSKYFTEGQYDYPYIDRLFDSCTNRNFQYHL